MEKACWAPVLDSYVLFGSSGFCQFRGRCCSLCSTPPLPPQKVLELVSLQSDCKVQLINQQSPSLETWGRPVVQATATAEWQPHWESLPSSHLLGLSFLHPFPTSSPILSCPPHPPISPHRSLLPFPSAREFVSRLWLWRSWLKLITLPNGQGHCFMAFCP